MAEAVEEKTACSKCGADIRENTSFCYNCGERVVTAESEHGVDAGVSPSELDTETQSALADLAEKFRIDEEEDGRLAEAAAVRRKARVKNRKSVRYRWEATEGAPSLIFVLLTGTIFLLSLAVVVFTSLWK